MIPISYGQQYDVEEAGERFRIRVTAMGLVRRILITLLSDEGEQVALTPEQERRAYIRMRMSAIMDLIDLSLHDLRLFSGLPHGDYMIDLADGLNVQSDRVVLDLTITGLPRYVTRVRLAYDRLALDDYSGRRRE